MATTRVMAVEKAVVPTNAVALAISSDKLWPHLGLQLWGKVMAQTRAAALAMASDRIWHTVAWDIQLLGQWLQKWLWLKCFFYMYSIPLS